MSGSGARISSSVCDLMREAFAFVVDGQAPEPGREAKTSTTIVASEVASKVTDACAYLQRSLGELASAISGGDASNAKPTALPVCSASVVERFLFDLNTFLQSERGRERLFRAGQYAGRLLHGLTMWNFFLQLSKVMALTRKGMRFGGPLRLALDLFATLDKIRFATASPSTDGATTVQHSKQQNLLTFFAISQDILYHSIDHIAFLERIQLLRISAERSDLLDRFIECFWLTEIIPLFTRDALEAVRLWKTQKINVFKHLLEYGRDFWVSRILQDQSRTALKVQKQDPPNTDHLLLATNLIKLGLCDFPCVIFVLRSSAFRQKRKHKIWCGALGVVASLISCYWQWRKVNAKDPLKDYEFFGSDCDTNAAAKTTTAVVDENSNSRRTSPKKITAGVKPVTGTLNDSGSVANLSVGRVGGATSSSTALTPSPVKTRVSVRSNEQPEVAILAEEQDASPQKITVPGNQGTPAEVDVAAATPSRETGGSTGSRRGAPSWKAYSAKKKRGGNRGSGQNEEQNVNGTGGQT
ncbi:unnamed protein product [Amoebophrya sp. A120]|nr:unnamed protein product [Amoebophrya sp. A120]|eukprot:GSA120T00012685001.1